MTWYSTLDIRGIGDCQFVVSEFSWILCSFVNYSCVVILLILRSLKIWSHKELSLLILEMPIYMIFYLDNKLQNDEMMTMKNKLNMSSCSKWMRTNRTKLQSPKQLEQSFTQFYRFFVKVFWYLAEPFLLTLEPNARSKTKVRRKYT